jgi:hypothetical protein
MSYYLCSIPSPMHTDGAPEECATGRELLPCNYDLRPCQDVSPSGLRECHQPDDRVQLALRSRIEPHTNDGTVRKGVKGKKRLAFGR